MYTTKERIAVARVVSDMIKADNIIEESEIEMLNRLKQQYNIDSVILNSAHRVKFSDALSDLSELKDEKKIDIFKSIQSMAGVDGLCVPKEAMILLALKYVFGVEKDKKTRKYSVRRNNNVKLISAPTGENSITSQYVIYIEGKDNPEVNAAIRENLEVIVLTLRQWGFDFIYIPALIDEFRTMNMEYVKDVIGYMAPELSKETIDVVYERLLRMDTITFCNYVLAEKLQVEAVKNAEPSLFINIGTSIVPYTSVSGPVECYTEFLCIPTGADITSKIKDFVKAYSKLVSFNYTPNPAYLGDNNNRFKYFGFYKAMFDFLVKAEPKESDIIVHSWKNRFEFPQIAVDDLVLSPQEAAIYKLILDCTFNHQLGGLPSTHTIDTAIFKKQIQKRFENIYCGRQTTNLSGGSSIGQSMLPSNLAPIRSRIERKMREQLDGLANIDDFIPKLKDKKYVVTAPASRVKIRDGHNDKLKNITEYSWD